MKTKVLSTLVLLFALAQGAVAEGTARNFGGGDGSAKNPYLINSPDQWGKLSADVAAGDGYPIHGSPVRATRVFRAFSTPFVGTCSHGGLHPRLWSWQPFRLRNELANIFRVSDFFCCLLEAAHFPAKSPLLERETRPFSPKIKLFY